MSERNHPLHRGQRVQPKDRPPAARPHRLSPGRGGRRRERRRAGAAAELPRPDPDGRAAAQDVRASTRPESLRADPRTQHIPIIVITSFALSGDREQGCRLAGAASLPGQAVQPARAARRWCGNFCRKLIASEVIRCTSHKAFDCAPHLPRCAGAIGGARRQAGRRAGRAVHAGVSPDPHHLRREALAEDRSARLGQARRVVHGDGHRRRRLDAPFAAGALRPLHRAVQGHGRDLARLSAPGVFGARA